MKRINKEPQTDKFLTIIILLVSLLLSLALTSSVATTYHIGPGYTYENINDLAWESIAPGDSVLIHHRDSAYHEKWVICRAGSLGAPVVIKGISDSSGNLPVIDGRDATTRAELDFWNEARGVIKIGGASYPPDTTPAYIIIENLDIKSGRPAYSFTGRSGVENYANNCAAIYIEKGEHLIIRGCILRDCGNGLFCGHLTTDLVVEKNHIYDNGIDGRWYEHNNYTEAYGILFQFNHFGPLRTGCEGNNLKDRSAGCVIRYNWIENGNRQLDLVDSDYESFYNDTLYRSTFVYGNMLLEGEGEGNSQVIHYGGDSGEESRYRKGTLYLYNNTIVSTRSGNTTLVRLSSDDETCDARNNIIYTTAEGYRLALLNDAGTLELRNNWLKNGWVNTHSPGTETVIDHGGNIQGNAPGFSELDAQNFTLLESSPCINSGTKLASDALPDHLPEMHYIQHCLSEPRPADDTLDIGAYEYQTTQVVKAFSDRGELKCLCYPNPFNKECKLVVPRAAEVRIYDLSGRCVCDEGKGAGPADLDGENRVLTWQPAADNPSGVFLLKVIYDNRTVSRKIIYLE